MVAKAVNLVAEKKLPFSVSGTCTIQSTAGRELMYERKEKRRKQHVNGVKDKKNVFIAK